MDSENRNGILIVCEGIDGSGKSTLAHALANHYARSVSVPVRYTKQPGGTAFGLEVRTLLEKYYDYKVRSSLAEFLLFAADRAHHIREIIAPSLARGEWVICDRFTDSSLVYQGFMHNVPLNLIHTVHAAILGDIRPAITLYCRVSREVAKQRIMQRGGENMFDKAADASLDRLIAGFDALYAHKDAVILDAEQSQEIVFDQACRIIDQRIQAR